MSIFRPSIDIETLFERAPVHDPDQRISEASLGCDVH